MKKFTLSFLCNTVLLIALSLPADARTTIGLTSTATPSSATQINVDQLSQELGLLSGTAVKVRMFENDAAITNWLLRFQEIDAAIVAPSYVKLQPAGSLTKLVDLHSQKSSLTPLVLVVRSNLASNKREQIKKVFLELGTSKTGRETLAQIGLAGVTLPGEPLRQKEVTSISPPTQTAPKQQAPVAAKKLTPKPAPAPQPTKQEVVVAEQKATSPTTTKQPQTIEKTLATTPATAPETPPQAMSKKDEKQAEIVSTKKAETEQVAPEVKEPPAKEAQPSTATKTAVKPLPSQKEVKTEETASKPAPNKRLTLFIVLIILAAIIFKICLFVLRWKKTKESAFSSEESPVMEPSFTPEQTIAQKNAPAEPFVDQEDIVIEEGRLGPGKVPQLLKRCADLPRPVVLHVTKGSCEKLVYFAGGQVSGALTQHSTIEESGVRWNKLGNLLVREELITREERDQGMALLAKEPGLRFGEALLKLGLIDLAGLRHALTRQAKVTIYSLILYPEGRYQIYSGDGSLPPEESVSLEVTALIREASHHQTEWAAIRQALPNLNTALQFTPDGRSKLSNVHLSPQQEETLTHIDGNRTINEICTASSMMDYEIYRFLYLMVKAGVLN